MKRMLSYRVKEVDVHDLSRSIPLHPVLFNILSVVFLLAYWSDQHWYQRSHVNTNFLKCGNNWGSVSAFCVCEQ